MFKNSLVKIAGNTKIITVGNEKGGSGKSTCAIHIAIALLRMGYTVGTIDLDARQGTLTRFVQSRFSRIAKDGENMPCPMHIDINKSRADTINQAQEEEDFYFFEALSELAQKNDFIVIDTAGHDTHLNRLGHVYADILVTPINDSLIDLDVLAKIDNKTGEIIKPSFYSDLVWQEKKRRAALFGKSMNWVVVRNRLSHISSKNKQNMQEQIEKISKRFGFRLTSGLGERVIFKELFLDGLTMMDIGRGNSIKMTVSHLAAKQEVRNIIHALGIPPKTASTPPTSQMKLQPYLQKHPMNKTGDTAQTTTTVKDSVA